MVVVRLTKKLAEALGAELEAGAAPTDARLGDWHANLARLALGPVAVCVNDETRVAVLCPLGPGGTLGDRFEKRLAPLLAWTGVPAAEAKAEAQRHREQLYAPTRDRRVLGSLKEVILMAESYDEGTPVENEDDLVALEKHLLRMVHLKLDETYPESAVRRVFGVPEPEGGRRRRP